MHASRMQPRNVSHIFSAAVQRRLERDAFEHAGALGFCMLRSGVRCGGRLNVIASIEEPELIERILAHRRERDEKRAPTASRAKS